VRNTTVNVRAIVWIGFHVYHDNEICMPMVVILYYLRVTDANVRLKVTKVMF